MHRLVVVTDLDGTLLDARTYGTEAAAPALAALRSRAVPLVICTSKTRAEVEPLRRSLGLAAPYIVENGGAIVAPAGSWPAPDDGGEAFTLAADATDEQVIALGAPYLSVVAALADAAAETGVPVRGFHDMSTDDVASATGLPPVDAERARRREYGEAFTILEPARAPVLFAALERRGFRWTAGGRFHHVFAGNDKGDAVRQLVTRYRRAWPGLVTAGLGDAPNDVSMLLAVDRPVIVRGPHAAVMRQLLPGAPVTAEEGPAGWNTAVLSLLEEFGG